MLLGMEVRELGRDEAAVWRELRLAALRDSPDAFGRTYEEEAELPMDAWEERVGRTADSPSAVNLVVESGGRPVGLAHCRLDDEHPSRAQIFAMWVRPEARGKGAGRRLVERALSWAADIGAATAELEVTEGNEAAFGCYASAGFDDTGERRPLREGSDVWTIRMRRALDLRLADEVVGLRRWSRKDLPGLPAAIDDPEIERFIPAIPLPYMHDHGTEFLQDARRKWAEGSGFVFAIADAETDDLLGGVGIERRSSGVWEVGYWVKRDARRRGVATRAVRLAVDWAFGHLDIVRLQLRTDVNNVASRKVAERNGFVREGLLRAAGRLRTGEHRDEIMHSLLRSELTEARGDPRSADSPYPYQSSRRLGGEPS